jgi:diguanylate cyclase (GGDEF)-like protein
MKGQARAAASSQERARQEHTTEDSEREVACSMTGVLLRLIRAEGGDAAVAEVLERAGAKHEVSYLEAADNWISLAESTALIHAGIEVTGEEHLARRVGENILRQHAGTQVATILRSLGSTEAVLETVTETTSRLSAVTKMESVEARPGHAVVRALVREGFTRLPVHCELTAGLLSATPMLFGLPLARVEESDCITRGDAHCLYSVSWDAELAAAAADPQQRVTALEAQLVAMTERLQGAYATAGDLISTADLDTLLRRIVERAAHTVRAPSHILAVRTAPRADVQVYGHGIDDARAQQIARAALAADVRASAEPDTAAAARTLLQAPADDSVSANGGASAVAGAPAEAMPGVEPAADAGQRDSMLIVDVTSGRRSYGKLIARYPGGARFFPQEHELLNLYARHAAAVLDMATALEESAHRHDQVSSLLNLSHEVAQAGTSEEVAKRLAVAVPKVVDCDRMSVWLWDAERRELRSVASWGRTEEQERCVAGLALSPEAMPALRDLIEQQQPLFFELGTDDEAASQMMSAMSVVAVAVVPIVAREAFLGALMVSVVERAERLRSDDESLDHLTGVAALAATAIQNGQLVDKLRYRAHHDGLTGLLNRVGFRQHIDALLEQERAHGSLVGLLFIDLDDFKLVNDSYGHEAGDEVLRKAAGRLASITRASDVVARLGGDEFAVVLDGIDKASQVRAAEARVRMAFIEPFAIGAQLVALSASVGGGMWPEHGRTVAELVHHADAAMYADKAKARGAVRERDRDGGAQR